jgi:Asp/Glu/hydantoin racemase
MKKLCIITVAPVPPEYYDAVTQHYQGMYSAILQEGTEIQVRGIPRGPAINPETLPDYRNTYYNLLLKQGVVEAALQAEADGFDAVVVNCFDDPGVVEARGVVGIPVFGICEPSMHFVCQLGRRFGALVPDLPGQAEVVFEQVRQHGLSERLLTNGVRTEPKDYRESQPESSANPEAMAGRLRELAVQLVHEGASAVLVACGGLGEAAQRAGLHSIDVDGDIIPVVTPLSVALKHCEMMLDLQRAHGFPIPSQGQDLARLNSDDKQRIREGFGVA